MLTNQTKIVPVIERFLLCEETLNIIKNMTPQFGFNGLGELVFRRTYSRDNEDWVDVVKRVIEGCMSIRKDYFIKNSLDWDDDKWQDFAKKMTISLFKMEWLPPGRGLWMMGTDFTYNRGSMSLYNCFRVDTKFWTSTGIKCFNDFNHGDSVIIRGKYDWFNATVQCFGKQELWLVILLNQSKTECIHIYTTKEHMWISADDEYFTTEYLSDKYLQHFSIDKNKQNKYDDVVKISYDDEDSYWKVIDTSPTGIIEDVWCVVEPLEHKFTLEHGILTRNCAATDTTVDIVHSAEWAMDCLMNGVGVGFNTMWCGEIKQPDKTDTELYVIPDSREGWVSSLIKLLCSYIESNKYGKNKYPIFDYSKIRKKGMPIKGFGGTASGHEPLKDMHDRIDGYLGSLCKERLQCKSKTYKEVTPGDWQEVEVDVDKPYSHTRFIADVFNAIGACVVAG